MDEIKVTWQGLKALMDLTGMVTPCIMQCSDFTGFTCFLVARYADTEQADIEPSLVFKLIKPDTTGWGDIKEFWPDGDVQSYRVRLDQ